MKVSAAIRSFVLLLCIGITGCQKEFNWNLVATGTLKSLQYVCLNSEVHGMFYSGVPPQSDTTYLQVLVDVFTPGSYSISTEQQNGLQFAYSGFFTSTGLQTVKLRPAGTPRLPGVFSFTVCFDTSCCKTVVNIKDTTSTDTLPLNVWSFTDTHKGISYHGEINATHLLVTPSTLLLSLRKQVTGQVDTSFEINIVFPTTNITTGIFTTDSLNALALSTGGICVNCAWEVMYKFYGVKSTIIVTAYDPRTRIIKGTFSGSTIDWLNHVAFIKDGAFNAVIN